MYGLPSPSSLMEKQLKLGLDLKGGVHLVLRVQTDDAIRLETEQEMERVREAATQRRHLHRRDYRDHRAAVRVEGVPPAQDAAFREALASTASNQLRPQPGADGSYTFTHEAEH